MIKILLSERLAERNMTQSELAQLTGIRPSTICDIYHNNIDRINLGHLEKICMVLKCSISDVMKLKNEAFQ